MSREIERTEHLLFFQSLSVVILIAAGIGVGIIEFFFPAFFNYPYFQWSITPESILAFWPLFIYALIMSTLSSLAIIHGRERNQLFALGLTTSVIAGIWEEIGFRCIYICYAMITLTFVNFIWNIGTGFLGGLIGLIILVAGIFLCKNGDSITHRIAGAFAIPAGAYLGYLGFAVGSDLNLYLTLYDWVIIPLVNITTLWQFESILKGDHEPLFVFGAIIANGKFRDGHQYQGIIGYINSWFIGLVMLYAAMTYGLLTAIAIHAIYDIVIDVVHYAQRLRLHRQAFS